jgi:hypothetical protein
LVCIRIRGSVHSALRTDLNPTGAPVLLTEVSVLSRWQKNSKFNSFGLLQYLIRVGSFVLPGRVTDPDPHLFELLDLYPGVRIAPKFVKIYFNICENAFFTFFKNFL